MSGKKIDSRDINSFDDAISFVRNLIKGQQMSVTKLGNLRRFLESEKAKQVNSSKRF